MATVTIPFPDALRDRLAAMAARRSLSGKQPMEAIPRRALADHDAEIGFRTRAARGDPARGLNLIDHLDHTHAEAVDRPGS